MFLRAEIQYVINFVSMYEYLSVCMLLLVCYLYFPGRAEYAPRKDRDEIRLLTSCFKVRIFVAEKSWSHVKYINLFSPLDCTYKIISTWSNCELNVMKKQYSLSFCKDNYFVIRYNDTSEHVAGEEISQNLISTT